MLKLFGPDGMNRREMLRVGGLSVGGIALPNLLARPSAADDRPRPASFGKAKNCIILYLSGGAPQHDMFDPKPETPAEIRGEFQTIETTLPGVRIGEHLPLSAQIMDRVAIVRSMNHTHNDHGRGSYWMFTGVQYPGSVPDVNAMSRADYPHMGAVLTKYSPGAGPMFPFALVPHRMDVAGGRRAGQFAGFLGGKFDPLLTGGDPNADDFRLEHLPLAANESPDVIRRRLSLVDQLNRQTEYLNENALAGNLHESQQKALDVVGAEEVRRAVDLAAADPAERERYGRNLFGQSVLLGRRLLEAGARLVQCNWQRAQGRNGFAWDTHWNNFSALKEDLIPPFDRAFHALVSDLDQAGRLEETLVVVAHEFGRSPKITLRNAGREHWPDCYWVLFAGAGVRRGTVHGASDKLGAYPLDAPCTPADFVATIYHLLGVDPHFEARDQLGRPFELSKGEPLAGVVA